MVSWGTTANVSVPVSERPDPPPRALTVTRGARGGWLLEGGLSAAGSALEWLAALVASDPAALAAAARTSPPGARGVLAFPWLGGARAPWWRADVEAAIVGLGFGHGVADAARAVVEGVAYDVDRCLDAAGAGRTGPRPAEELVLGGGGASLPVWTEVLTGVTGLAAMSRRSGEAASAGAAILAAAAVGTELDLEHVDPVTVRTSPDASVVEAYVERRARADVVAAALMAGAGAHEAP
jgi:sugar (pentulose or hexulose) kinase